MINQALYGRLLRSIWAEENEDKLFGRMKEPVFRISEGERRLASWDADTRELAVSAHVFETMTMAEIEDVVRHEMAHQLADEHYGGRDEPPHGLSFQSACENLGIDHAARFVPRKQDSPHVQRIQKLLALAESDNVHEAEVAMSRARELMSKYGMDAMGGEAPEILYDYITPAVARRGAATQMIASLLCSFFSVHVVWLHTEEPTTGKTRYLLEVCGTRTHIEVAAYIYRYLHGEVERLWRAHRRAHGATQRGDKRSFQIGVLRGLRERLAREAEEEARPRAGDEGRSSEGSALVALDRSIERFVERRHPYLRRGRSLTFRASEHYEQGLEQGRELQIRDGVGGGETRGLLGS